MTEKFEVLTDAEYDQLVQTVANITIYIAAADGEIEREETKWAEQVTKIRAYNLPDSLGDFYKKVGVDFQERLDKLTGSLPKLQEERMAVLEADLAKVNPILAKLDKELAVELYNDFRSFAKHVAKSSGGILGFFSIGPKEADLIKLSMIDEVTL